MIQLCELTIETAIANQCDTRYLNTCENNNSPKKKTNSKRKNELKVIKFLSFFSFILITSLVHAQSNFEDVVYLKNGSIIRGIIIEQVPNQSIKIQSDRNVFFFRLDEIERITKEPIKGGGSSLTYRGIIELGTQFPVGDFGLARWKFNFINGIQFNPHFSFGLGTGLRYYYKDEVNAWLVPIFVDFRVNITKDYTTPYIALGSGYSFEASKNFNDVGFFLNTNVGISLGSTVNVGVGYELQRIQIIKNLLGVNSSAICFVFLGISF